MRCLLASLPLLAAAAPAAPVSFSREIAPILADQCLECHRAEKAKGSYRLDSFARLLQPGDSGQAAVVAGKPEASLLHGLLVTRDEADRMPKKADPLTGAQIERIARWIREGAAFDGPDRQAPLASLLPAAQRPQAPAKYPRPIPVTALAANGDGRVLVSSGYHEVLAWDPATGRLRGRIGGMPERILGLSFVRGGPLLAVAGGSPGRSGEVWLVDFAHPAERRRLVQMRDCALCAVTTPDGKILVTGGADNRVRGFALPEGRPLWDLEAHADWVLALAVSDDGRHIATASRDRTARVITAATGVIEGTFTGHSVPVFSVAFAPGGQEVISGAADGEIRRWTLQGAGKKDSTLKPGGRTAILQLGFLDAGTPLAGDALGQLTALDAQSRKVRARLVRHADRVSALAQFGAGESRRLFSASHDGKVRVLQGGDGRELSRFIASPGW